MNKLLFGPTSVFVSNDHDVYIADCNNHRIRILNNQNKIGTMVGNGQLGYSGDGGMARDAALNYPNGVFVSASGEVYIADYHNHRIRMVSNSGIIETIAGNGEGGFGGEGDLAINAKLNYPTSVFVSDNNEIYISDYHNHRIRKVLQNGKIITIAGNGQSGYSGDGGLAINAQLNCPMHIFVSNNNEVYISDSANHRIRKISSTGIIETIAGNGQDGFCGDGKLATNSKLNCPMCTFVTSNGDVFISDCNNNRIRKVSSHDGIIATIAGNGNDGFNGDGGLSTNAELNYPMGLFVKDQELYISDSNNHAIRKVLQNGKIITIAGYGPNSYGYNENI